MAKFYVAEGGRTSDEPCLGLSTNAFEGKCDSEDMLAWARRLQREIDRTNSLLPGLSPAGQWLGPAAAELYQQIKAWQEEAREWTDADDDLFDIPWVIAHGGDAGVIDEQIERIRIGDELATLGQAMIFQARPLPVPPPDPNPVPLPPVPEPEPTPEEENGGLFAALAVGATLGAVVLYAKRGTISSGILRSMRR